MMEGQAHQAGVAFMAAHRFPPSPATRRRMRGNNLQAPLNEVDYRLVSVFSPGKVFLKICGLVIGIPFF